MKRLLIVVVLGMLLSGCQYARRQRIYILQESQQYYFIPAGTAFHAVVVKGEPPVRIIRNSNTWAVDAGYLLKLQKEANAAVLEPPE